MALLLYFAVNTPLWIQWEFTEKLKSLRKVVIDWDGSFTLVFPDANIAFYISSFGCFRFLREQASERELAECFLFAVRIFVPELVLLCTSNVHLITDVYNHRSRRLFNEQRYFLNDWGVCSQPITVLLVVVGLLNICTKNVISVRKLERHCGYELAAESLFQKPCFHLTWN